MLELTGKVSLPIVEGKSRLGALYAIRAHMEDHRREPSNILARVRRHVWLTGGRATALRVAKSCMWCRRNRKTTIEQIMGKLPPEVFSPAPPFTAVCLDLFGPLLAKGEGPQVRKTFKVWGVLFVCLGSKAVSMWLAPSYSAKSFMLCFAKQSGIYGRPAKIISDKGSQLVGAQRELEEWEAWGNQVKQTGTEWLFTPTACPWRNGQTERCVALAKHTLSHVLEAHTLLSFAELEAALINVADVINKRPLAVRDFGEADFHPVSPSDLLLGRAHGYRPGQGEQAEEHSDQLNLPNRLEAIEELVKQWWRRWVDMAFPLFCPRKRWTQPHRNLSQGDIVMLKNDKKVGKAEYRLARVMEVMRDTEGMVRTVELGMRRRRGGRSERPQDCKQGLERVPMAVQRLVLLQPAGETWERDLCQEGKASPSTQDS